MESKNFTQETLLKLCYIIFCLLMKELIIGGKRIAFAGELKSIKMLMDPSDIDLDEDWRLLSILDEAHVKLAYDASRHIHEEMLLPYAAVHLLDDGCVMANKQAYEFANKMLFRFVYWRSKNRRRDRYINFNKVLYTAQRVAYECCKLLVTGVTRTNDPAYRSNYSEGRLRALQGMKPLDGCHALGIKMLFDLIDKFKSWHAESVAITEVHSFSLKK